jgi:hypothetical protein
VCWSFCALPILALAPPLPALAIAASSGVFSLGIVYGNALWETLQQREIPPERLSRVNAFDWMVSLIFMPIGQTLAGPLAEAVGEEPVLVGAALLILVPCLGVLPLPGVRNGPRLTTPPEEAPVTRSPWRASGSEGESPAPAPPDPLP